MTILVDRRFESVPVVILNRPERNNALSLELLLEFKKVLEDFSASDKVRGLILEGQGEHFCSGLDLKEAISDEVVEKSSITLREVFLLLATYPKVTIASVRGYALAGGLGLAALCDLVIASKDSRFQFPEVHRGLVPAYLLAILKTRFPPSLLRAMSLFSYPITGEEAFQRGIVHFLVEEKEREWRLKEAVSMILKGAVGTQFHIKNILCHSQEPNLRQELLLAEGVHRKSRESDEAREGITAFFEKRPPSWCK